MKINFATWISLDPIYKGNENNTRLLAQFVAFASTPGFVAEQRAKVDAAMEILELEWVDPIDGVQVTFEIGDKSSMFGIRVPNYQLKFEGEVKVNGSLTGGADLQ